MEPSVLNVNTEDGQIGRALFIVDKRRLTITRTSMKWGCDYRFWNRYATDLKRTRATVDQQSEVETRGAWKQNKIKDVGKVMNDPGSKISRILLDQRYRNYLQTIIWNQQYPYLEQKINGGMAK